MHTTPQLIPKTNEHDNFRFELSLRKQGFFAIAGSDEVGRGPLAGPVVAASVILPENCDASLYLDSKLLNHTRRLELFKQLYDIKASIGIGVVSPATIDEINILQASLLAMKRSVVELRKAGNEPDFILVDGKFEIPLPTPQQTLIKGESKSGSIAAASIIAKITRDKLMKEYHKQFPQYNFAQNKGYPTKEHKKAIARYGTIEIHRKTFRGVKDFVKK